jgi:S-adenosylmethionine-diacylglycerol 3-amino-3-carboxypropyl transferase
MSEYFNTLNYSLGNEDTNFERKLVQKLKPQKVFSICGCGSRAFPLAQAGVKEIHLLDLSNDQLALAKLREKTFCQLNYENFLKFWGYAPYQEDQNNDFRKKIFHELTLDEKSQELLTNYFEKINWNSLLYEGNWEKTFFLISRIISFVFKSEMSKIFSFDNLTDQKRYFKEKFPRWRWNVALFFIGQKAFFNRVLYHGNFIAKNVPESYFSYYQKAYNHLLNYDLTRNSFFLQLCFLGRIKYAEGNMIEAHPACFEEISTHLKHIQTFYHQGDACGVIKEHRDIDFVSFSDVPSYFSGDLEKSFLNEIANSLSSGAHVVIRNYLRVPNADRSSYVDVTSQFTDLIADEKVQMYKIEVLRKK